MYKHQNISKKNIIFWPLEFHWQKEPSPDPQSNVRIQGFESLSKCHGPEHRLKQRWRYGSAPLRPSGFGYRNFEFM
jgi:hypothetical protein